MAGAAQTGGWRKWVFLKRRGLVLVAAVLAMAGLAVEGTGWIASADWWVWAQVVGFGLIAYGEMFRFWATAHIGGRKSQAVVESGPYAWTRNPLYVGSLMCVMGIALLAASFVALVIGVGALAFIYGVTIRHEEAFLLRTLGDPYAEYMKKVPRFFPSRGANAAERIAKMNADKRARAEGSQSISREANTPETTHRAPARILWREAYTGLGFTIAGIVAMLIQQWVAHWQSNGTLPILFSPGWLFGS